MSGTVSNNISQGSGSITEPSGGVEIRSDDPTLSEGLMWYNTSANTLKVAKNLGAWSSGNSLSAVFKLGGGCGTQGAAMGSGPQNDTDGTQEYDGTNWSAGGNMNTGAYWVSNFGTQTAGTSCGGWDGGLGDATEEYNGTGWTATGDINTARYNGAAAGTQTAGLFFGGSNST